MSQKKLPTRSKLIYILVGFAASLYLLILGFSNLKAWYDFRPYKKLANELTETLNIDFEVTEHKKCNLEGPICPSIELNKNISLENSSAIGIKLSSYIESKNGTKSIDDCLDYAANNRCNLEFILKNFVIGFTADINHNSIKIYKNT